MQFPIIKVCGMRYSRNIRAVEQAGPDWMGFIFASGSPRSLRRRPSYLPERCRRVGVFVNPSLTQLLLMSRRFGLHLLQLHGNESPDFCRKAHDATGLDIVKTISVSDENDMALAAAYGPEQGVSHLLFDTKTRTGGGSGRKFDWTILSAYRGPLPFLLSGGIGPSDIPRLHAFHHPLCVGIDLNSRFEAVPGVKDATILSNFIREIRNT